MQHDTFNAAEARVQFRRFFSCARRFWDDGRHSGIHVSKRRCFACAAQHHGLSDTVFDRLFSACFAEQRDRMAELKEHLDACLEIRAQERGPCN